MQTNYLRVVTRACVLLIAIVGIAASAIAQPRRGGGITVYADINFSGASRTFEQDVPNLVVLGFNDAISSVHVADGEVWQICRDVNYQNRCENVSGSIADLRTMDWNDQISSLRRISGAGFRTRPFERTSRGVVVYANPNFTGRSATFRSDVPNLIPFGLNDQITSIDIPPGEAWEVCVDIDYGNRCTVLTGSVADLRRLGWNDRISSMRRVESPRDEYGGPRGERATAEHGLIFFDRPYFRGTTTLITHASSSVGIPPYGSVRISGGIWEICDVRGACITVDQDVADLGETGLVNRIVSVRELRPSPWRFPR